jgi:hypothetical protein
MRRFLSATYLPAFAALLLAAALPAAAALKGVEPSIRNPGAALVFALALWAGSRVVERGVGGLWQASAAGALVCAAGFLSEISLWTIARTRAGWPLPPGSARFFCFVFALVVVLGGFVGALFGER